MLPTWLQVWMFLVVYVYVLETCSMIRLELFLQYIWFWKFQPYPWFAHIPIWWIYGLLPTFSWCSWSIYTVYIYTIHWSYEILYYPTSASFGRTNDSRDLGIRTIDRCEESLRQDQHNQEITRKKKDLLVLPQWYLTWTWWVIQTILFRYNLDSKSVVGAHVKYRHQIFFLTDA